MSKIESLQAELINPQTSFERKLEIKDEIRKLEGKKNPELCNLDSDCVSCSG